MKIYSKMSVQKWRFWEINGSDCMIMRILSALEASGRHSPVIYMLMGDWEMEVCRVDTIGVPQAWASVDLIDVYVNNYTIMRNMHYYMIVNVNSIIATYKTPYSHSESPCNLVSMATSEQQKSDAAGRSPAAMSNVQKLPLSIVCTEVCQHERKASGDETVGDGAVDCRGRPCIRSRTGNWRASALIMGDCHSLTLNFGLKFLMWRWEVELVCSLIGLCECNRRMWSMWTSRH